MNALVFVVRSARADGRTDGCKVSLGTNSRRLIIVNRSVIVTSTGVRVHSGGIVMYRNFAAIMRLWESSSKCVCVYIYISSVTI